ncbi:T9SS type B sorting domain-containing protein [Flavobacterium sp.]|uniref:T9SS type B sorting domain-containing protein n=1 Tax=Flavobacterium sp. TaxID=239 RepID=UPI00286CC086|nr:T9SS type B sorting domain-containing protein [Flavobacterium sp.]
MKKINILPFLFFTSFVFSQQEASNWYFGSYAGIKFHPDGSVTALTDGQLNTKEGCATISDSSGNLLFYTDGSTIWNKNHQLMLNGTGLLGHWSSTQAATIVPLPSSTHLFYVFTLDFETNPNGFRYSIVDLDLDGGLGAVTSQKNILIYTPSDEKLSIVKHKNGIDFWVVTHGFNSNTFYSYLLTASGLNATPVLSNSGNVVSNFYVWGYMKISPDGTKLAMAHAADKGELFDFDTTTGIVSNARVIYENSHSYGVEFSPNSAVLYVSNMFFGITQYDLTTNPITSTSVYNGIAKALQLGPNGKIYIAVDEQDRLEVINNPNIYGLGCDLQTNAVSLLGRKCMLGLPPFIASFFYKTSFAAENLCLGSSTKFTTSTNLTNITSANWDFGDGTTSTDINPLHTYALSGTYKVSVVLVSSAGTSAESQDIIISKVPTATKPQDLLICDTNNNGLSTFDLTTQNTAILNGQDPNLYTITYFANATDYANNLVIATPTSYTNTVPYQQQTIIAEVSNNANTTCKSSTNFNIDVFDAPKPSTTIPKLTTCDNTSVGTDVDGRVLFDLTQRATTVLNGQYATQFMLSYYKDVALTQNIATPNTYANTNVSETIYVKMVNKDNLLCAATTSFPIEVLPLPVITNVVSLKQCDDNIDGYSVFNLEEAIAKITTNAATETIAFFRLPTDAQNNTNSIANPTTYTNQVVSNDVAYVRVTNANGCFRVAQLNLIVSTTQIPLNFAKTFMVCDDAILGTNVDGIATFDFSSVTNQIQNIFPVGQLLDISYYKNLTDALAEKNAITDISNYRNSGYPNTQKIYVRVDSQVNNDCLGLGSHITLNVEKIPIVKPIVETQCDDNQDGLYAFNTTTLQAKLLNGLTNVTVTYFDQNNVLLSSPLPNPFNTTSQTLKVVVTKNTPTACSFETTLQFVVDDLPEAFPISVNATTICDEEANPVQQDGRYAFDTTAFQNTILGTQTGMVVKYFDQNNNPISSPLPNPFVTATQNVRVEVINSINTTCKAITIIAFVVNPVPKINLLGDELVCTNLPTFTKILDAGLLDATPTGNYSYVWSFNGSTLPGATNYSLIVNTAGLYTVKVTNNQGCSRTRTLTVVASDSAKITGITIVDLAVTNSISVTVSGAGNYVYTLDDEFGTYQTESVFNNVTAGIHTVFVKDLNGCGVTPKEVAVLGIPNYFTPNNDGFNDYWNLKGVNAFFNSKTIIYIFDRYGKLIAQINPLTQGWNGIYNGQQMPATDYWYSVALEDGRVMKGHFALKR